MSLFFVSSDKDSLGRVKKSWDELFEKECDIYDGENVSMVMASGVKKFYLMKASGENKVFVVGTIFNRECFNQELLDSYKDCETFINDVKSEEQLFYGHFIVIYVCGLEGRVEIIPDRVGMLNIYYATDATGNMYISNDVLEVSKNSKNTELYGQAVCEFVLTESNVSSTTIFKQVYRVAVGMELVLENGILEQKRVYEYNIEKISREAYLERIERYFSAFNNYKGKISADLSAGYDTRLITVIANKYITELECFTALHGADGGIDAEISQIISERLGIKWNTVAYGKEALAEKNCGIVLHGAAVMRDVRRSQKMPYMLSAKYQNCDLALGGYGGECIRAKYNKYPNTTEFIEDYYKGLEAEKICRFRNYSKELQTELNEIAIPKDMSEELLQNWYYTVAKMRIWGSGFIQTSSLYGDVVHPFMDWYLLGPIFGFDRSDLRDAKLQEELINIHAPELGDIPINKRINESNKMSLKDTALKKANSTRLARNIVTYLYCVIRNQREVKKAKCYVIPQNLQTQNELDFESMLKTLGQRISSRTGTVIDAYKYVTNYKE